MEKRRNKEYPTGVRPTDSGGLRIWFYWPKGSKTQIYEPFSESNTPTKIKNAGILRKKIVEQIKHDVFDYSEHFPDSIRATTIIAKTFAHHARDRLNSPTVSWTNGTRDKYRGIINNYWMPELEHKLIHLITLADLTRTLTGSLEWYLEENGEEVSKSLYNLWLTVLRGVFNQAITAGAIKKVNNPAAELTNKTRPKVEPDPLTQEEANDIINDIYKHDGEVWGAWFELAFFSGMRYPSEPAALTWSSINLRQSTVAPHGSIKITQIRTKDESDGIKKTTKTGVARTVNLNSRSRQAILMIKKHTAFNEWVFLLENGNPVTTSAAQRIMWRASLARLGIRERVPYCTRHTYATIGLMAGNNPAYMAKQLGHSLQEFFKTYATWIEMTNNNQQIDLMEAAIQNDKNRQKTGRINSENSQVIDIKGN